MGEMNASMLLILILAAAVIGFALGCIFWKQKDSLKEQKKKVKASEQEHDEEEDKNTEKKSLDYEFSHSIISRTRIWAFARRGAAPKRGLCGTRAGSAGPVRVPTMSPD